RCLLNEDRYHCHQLLIKLWDQEPRTGAECREGKYKSGGCMMMEQTASVVITQPTRPRVAEKVRTLPPSGIRAFFELVIGRSDVISLGVGEPDFVTPWHIREPAMYRIG